MAPTRLQCKFKASHAFKVRMCRKIGSQDMMTWPVMMRIEQRKCNNHQSGCFQATSLCGFSNSPSPSLRQLFQETPPLLGIIWAANLVVWAYIFTMRSQGFLLCFPHGLHKPTLPQCMVAIWKPVSKDQASPRLLGHRKCYKGQLKGQRRYRRCDQKQLFYGDWLKKMPYSCFNYLHPLPFPTAESDQSKENPNRCLDVLSFYLGGATGCIP